MKPIKLTLSAFGPFAGLAEVNFAALGSSGLWVSCALGAGSWELPRDKNLPDSCQESYPTHLNIDPVTKRGSEVGVACFLSSFTNNFAAKNKLCFPSQEPW